MQVRQLDKINEWFEANPGFHCWDNGSVEGSLSVLTAFKDGLELEAKRVERLAIFLCRHTRVVMADKV